MNIKEIVEYVARNWDAIPDGYKSYLKPEEYSKNIDGVSLEEHFVVLLLDRQKPSVEVCYDFDEERIGVTRTGKIIWGFDSGCSCPSPWDDSYPDCYSVSKTWKEFELNQDKFDVGFLEECNNKIMEIEKAREAK